MQILDKVILWFSSLIKSSNKDQKEDEELVKIYLQLKPNANKFHSLSIGCPFYCSVDGTKFNALYFENTGVQYCLLSDLMKVISLAAIRLTNYRIFVIKKGKEISVDLSLLVGKTEKEAREYILGLTS
jgi:hypothetical protein